MEIGIHNGWGRYWGKCLDRKGARVCGVHLEGICTFYYILPVSRSPARARQGTPMRKIASGI